ncbi:MAG: SUMF1/EgtB/PvdO family nonheme iron enzyme [Pseudomonadota bacterium]
MIHSSLALRVAAGIALLFGLAACGERDVATHSCAADIMSAGEVEVVLPSGRAIAVDTAEVTNAEFAAFVEATGYVTRAERGLPEPEYDSLPDEARRPGSAVFVPPESGAVQLNPMSWWAFVEGADWRRPGGPGTDIEGKDNHPVVHIAYEDAVAYAQWVGRRLPNAQEWEFAARGGLEGKRFEWGDRAITRDDANYWQGIFPVQNTGEDGHLGTAPVGCFPANDYGLHDMSGNVWEWTTTEVGRGTRLLKGGSYLCANNYCSNFRPGGEQPQEASLGTNHIGFRTVADVE